MFFPVKKSVKSKTEEGKLNRSDVTIVRPVFANALLLVLHEQLIKSKRSTLFILNKITLPCCTGPSSHFILMFPKNNRIPLCII